MKKQDLREEINIKIVNYTTGLDNYSHTLDKCVQIAKDYAEQEAIEFSEWLQQNRWFSFQNGYWYYTFENAIAISNEAYNKKYRKTTSELYQLFKNRENER